MAAKLPPRLDILPMAQRPLWDELAGVPAHFVLYGGMASRSVAATDAAVPSQPHEPGRDGPFNNRPTVLERSKSPRQMGVTGD
jgi:hypothetical protein